MRIQNNNAAFNVWSNYTNNVFGMKRSMAKLSTGQISNTDDPAGVGISERMRAQISGTAMSRQNTENGISLVKTADSWLQKVNDQLARMKALAIEAKGIMSTADKKNVQTEFKAMQEEVTRITSKYTSAAKFNGLYLFRGGNGIAEITNDNVEGVNPNGAIVGDGKKITIQIGADVDQTIDLSLSNLEVTNTSTIGTVSTYSYSTSHELKGSSHQGVEWGSIIDVNKMSVASMGAIGKIDIAINYIANARASLGSQQKRMEQTRAGLLTYEDNLRAAESKIRDVDMARETTLFAKYQILSNASNAMLAQANQLPGSVLQLLG
jgi:flagellin